MLFPLTGTIIVDSNLLLLLVIGSTDRTLICRYQRTQSFSEADFDALLSILSRASHVLTTPHVLTEVSNLANKLTGEIREQFSIAFREMILRLEERFQPASTLAVSPSFLFGLADISLLHESDSALVLTQDGRFASLVASQGGLALNHNTAVALGKDFQ